MRIYKNFRRFQLPLNTIKKITLTQFRNYTAASFDFKASITCIAGPNGVGKTNLLDAVYYLCYTKSYFSAYQQNSVKSGTDGFRLEGIFNAGRGGDEIISCKWKAGRKEILADDAPYEKITDHIGKYSAVMIAPDDMSLINNGSEGRRKWIDSILGQTDKAYLEHLMQYQRILQQRNAWLKMHALNPPFSSPELEFYDRQMALSGNYIFEKRKTFTEEFLPLQERFYEQLSGGKEKIGIIYKADLHEQTMESWFRKSFQQDLRLQRTSRGVHRDDLEFYFNGLDLKQFGSQGQKKSYLFALKLAQYAYLSLALNHLPILLLDDIFEKLDQNRMESLLKIIRGAGFGQVILTDTHPERVRDAFQSEENLAFILL